MEYTNYLLFVVGLLGILTHNLMKIDKLNRKTNGGFKIKTFIRLEWPSILISIIVVIVCLVARMEVKQLKAIGNWLALGFFAIGLAAQSVAYFIKGKAEKNLEAEDQYRNIMEGGSNPPPPPPPPPGT